MDSEAPAVGMLLLIGLGVWLLFGTPMRDIRGWTGNQTYEDQLAILSDHVEKKKIGITRDYWLTKTDLSGAPDRVALIFGMWGDEEFCQELADLYMGKYPQSRYYCLSANSE